jgi:hypothetical protein
MLPPNSSTSSSEPRPEATSWKRLRGTTLWVLFFLTVFELGVWAIFTKTRLAGGSVHRYLWYGTSYEVKLRDLVNTPNLPPRSVLYAGWLTPETLKGLPANPDLTIYGMSFTANLSAAIAEIRPDLSLRTVGGPGAPLNHTYAMYELDRPLRKTKVAVIGATSAAVQEILLMNRGSLFSDFPFPYFFPRYRLENGSVVRAASSLINSSDELRRALEDRTLWERQLSVLARNDDAYRRFLFASDPLDKSALGRMVRRGLSKRHLESYTSQVFGPRGYNQKHEAVLLFRAMLRQMVRELRAEQVEPIVVLFALQGYGNHFYEMVKDVLREDAIPYVNSYDLCPSENRGNYLPDLHFVHGCDLAFAKRTLELARQALAGSRPN